MSYTHHAKLMRKLFADLGVDTTKLTHELRIFAAQLLYEMGVPLEVRCGVAWLVDMCLPDCLAAWLCLMPRIM